MGNDGIFATVDRSATARPTCAELPALLFIGETMSPPGVIPIRRNFSFASICSMFEICHNNCIRKIKLQCPRIAALFSLPLLHDHRYAPIFPINHEDNTLYTMSFPLVLGLCILQSLIILRHNYWRKPWLRLRHRSCISSREAFINIICFFNILFINNLFWFQNMA